MVKCRVGGLHEPRIVRTVAVGCDAYADRDKIQFLARPVGQLDRDADAFADQFCNFRHGARHYDQEFLAAKPAYEVFLAQGTGAKRRDLLQNMVANRVTKPVVDRFEMVDIQNSDSQRRTFGLCRLDGIGQHHHHLPAIGNGGQLVGLCQML